MSSAVIEVTIQGTTPILLNRFTDEAGLKAGNPGTSIIGEQGTPREQCVPKLYTAKDGSLILPGPNIFSCLIQAGTFHKIGKNKVTTQKSSLVPAGIGIREIATSLRNNGEAPDETQWEVDSRRIVNPSTGGARLCHRPRLDAWTTRFTLDVDTTMFDLRFVRRLVDDAGKRIGLGDFRPSRKGPFGKFVVTRWEVKEA